VRILYHHRTASRDGQAVHIEEMIGGLRALGHQVRVVAPSAGKQAGMGASIGWVHRLKDTIPRALYELMELGYSALAYRRLARAMREFQPDVIYERYNLFQMAGLMAKRRFGVPLILEVNSPLVHERSRFDGLALQRLARWSEGTLWRGADRVLPVTQVLAAYVTAYGVPEERVTVIPNGVNAAQFAGAGSPAEAQAALGLSGRLVLGFTGFLRDWHGVDGVIRWMGEPSVSDVVHLLVVGDGPARRDLERLAHAHNLAHRVTFTGVVARERIPAYVAAFDVALQPAVVPYASPLKLFEYLAAGKAVVAPRQANLEEILVDRRNVLFFDPSDPDGLSSALNRIANDRELREALAVGAAATIQAQGLTWVAIAKRVSALCASLAHNQGAARALAKDAAPGDAGTVVMRVAQRDASHSGEVNRGQAQ